MGMPPSGKWSHDLQKRRAATPGGSFGCVNAKDLEAYRRVPHSGQRFGVARRS